MKTVQDYINLAWKKVQEDGTFAAKAHQKEALGYLNLAYENVRNANQTWQLAPETRASNEDYWALPFDLHQIRDKHTRLFKDDLCADLARLVELRRLFKNAQVVKPAPKDDRITAKQKEVTDTVVDMIKRRTAQYHEAVELGRLFGGLPVSVTPHQVTNEYNTTFTRCFYYLAGKFTPLQVILGAMDTLAREEKKPRYTDVVDAPADWQF
tara:strand:+ start:39 stop:668 length:630 start_codon:yes stop_codon:yes gene_type:complete